MERPIIYLLKEGLIGLEAEVRPKGRTGLGFKGTIIDETKNIIEIKKGSEIKKFIKKANDFEIRLGSEKVCIRGAELVGRPEERIKKWLRSKSRRKGILGSK